MDDAVEPRDAREGEQQVRPAAHVFGFAHAVADHVAAAHAVAAAIGREYGVSGAQQEIRVREHSTARIAHPVQRDDGATVGPGGREEPGVQHSIPGDDLYRLPARSGLTRELLRQFPRWRVAGPDVQGALGDHHGERNATQGNSGEYHSGKSQRAAHIH